MLELAIKGSKKYYGWMVALLVLIGVGFSFYLRQLEFGLGVTGMSRDVSWGFYIAQFTFLVGIAASAVIVILPYYLHDFKAFGRITVLGLFLAVSADVMCLLFLFIDLGQPMRILNTVLYPSLHSILFWDMIALVGHLLLSVVIGWKVLDAERNGVTPQPWVKPLIYLSIPWAVVVHGITAYLYGGLPGRGYWMTTVLAPRFLASAFASGPALLVLLCMVIRRVTTFDPGKEQIQSLAKIAAYGLCLNVFFFLCEVFTVLYSRLPEQTDHFYYLFAGLSGHSALVPWMWISVVSMVVAIILLVNPVTRKDESILVVSCLLVFVGIWIDKGMGVISGGFVPSPLNHISEYVPTFPEIVITAGVYGVGIFMLTALYKIIVSVKEETRS